MNRTQAGTTRLRSLWRSGKLALLLTAVGGVCQADTLLLSDNFNSPSYGASTFNSTLAADQAGTLATVTYSISGYSADHKIQHGNGAQMLMAGWHDSVSLDLYASLNHNFADEATATNVPLVVQFTLSVTAAADTSNWAAVSMGSSQNLFVNNPTNKFSSLFRLSGGTQQFASGTEVSTGASWTAAGSMITVILSDTAGTGSPFNGSGSVARMYVNGVLAGTFTLAQMTAADGYITLEAMGAFALCDNLSVSLLNPAAITWAAPAAISGDSDVATTGTVVYAYDQCNSDQTVNGVQFAGGYSTHSLGGGNVTLLGFDGATTNSGGPGAGGDISDAYHSALDGFTWKNTGSPASLTLNNLVAGREYVLQFWVADYRTNDWASGDRTETLAAVNTSAPLRYMDADNTYGIHGSYVTGTFTANGGCQTISLAANESAQMNAVQLRQMVEVISADGYFDGASSTAWDQGITADWASVSGGPFNKLWTSWSVAHFEGTGGAVAIGGEVDANGVIFDVDGYTLSGGTLRTGSPGGGPHITVNGASATIGSAIAGTGAGAIKDGNGTLVLSNVGSQSFASMTIASGVLELSVPSDLDSGAGTAFYGDGTLRKTGAGQVSWGSAATTFALGSGALIDVQGGGIIGGSWANETWTANKSDLNVAAGASFTTVEANVRVNRISGSGTIGTGFSGAGYRTLAVGVDGGSSTFNGVIQNSWANGSFAGNLTKEGSGTITLTGSNTYAGVTVLAGGVLNVSSLSNYGVAGALGNRASDPGGEDMGLLFRGGALQYTGATPQSTDRAIRISTTGGGATLDASGSVPSATMSFTAATSPNLFENPGDRTLTLTGSNSGSNVFAMAIQEAGGTTTLDKRGTGTWVLTGTSTFTGLTTIYAGTLKLGSDNTLNANNNVVLAGGALDIGGASNQLGTLAVGDASHILLGSGNVSFADSSAIPWTGRLTLVGILEKYAVRFGNSSSGLTTAQLASIDIAGTPVGLDGDGYLVRAASGLVLQVR